MMPSSKPMCAPGASFLPAHLCWQWLYLKQAGCCGKVTLTKLRWVRRLGCSPMVLCCHCWVLSEWPHSVEGNSFPKHWHPAGYNSTLLMCLAHFNSNEFTVWVLFFIIIIIIVFCFCVCLLSSFPGPSSSIGKPGPERSTPYESVMMVKLYDSTLN